jgi:hypothetical protein
MWPSLSCYVTGRKQVGGPTPEPMRNDGNGTVAAEDAEAEALERRLHDEVLYMKELKRQQHALQSGGGGDSGGGGGGGASGTTSRNGATPSPAPSPTVGDDNGDEEQPSLPVRDRSERDRERAERVAERAERYTIPLLCSPFFPSILMLSFSSKCVGPNDTENVNVNVPLNEQLNVLTTIMLHNDQRNVCNHVTPLFVIYLCLNTFVLYSYSSCSKCQETWCTTWYVAPFIFAPILSLITDMIEFRFSRSSMAWW